MTTQNLDRGIKLTNDAARNLQAAASKLRPDPLSCGNLLVKENKRPESLGSNSIFARLTINGFSSSMPSDVLPRLSSTHCNTCELFVPLGYVALARVPND
jgi:hypothetical protein